MDFFDYDDQDTIQLYQDIYEACVENHLIVNAHGANKPTGEARTYPNVINREAVCGEEMGSYNTVKNTTVWAFTRGVVGPMDVTPRIYNGSITTGHSAAMNILFQSGMPCMASSVEDYRSSPAMSLLKNLPAQWDNIHS